MIINKNVFYMFKQYYFNNEIKVINGYMQLDSLDQEIFHGIKFFVKRLDCDIWYCEDEFELILIMNMGYRCAFNNHKVYPCTIEFKDHTDEYETTRNAQCFGIFDYTIT